MDGTLTDDLIYHSGIFAASELKWQRLTYLKEAKNCLRCKLRNYFDSNFSSAQIPINPNTLFKILFRFDADIFITE